MLSWNRLYLMTTGSGLHISVCSDTLVSDIGSMVTCPGSAFAPVVSQYTLCRLKLGRDNRIYSHLLLHITMKGEHIKQLFRFIILIVTAADIWWVVWCLRSVNSSLYELIIILYNLLSWQKHYQLVFLFRMLQSCLGEVKTNRWLDFGSYSLTEARVNERTTPKYWHRFSCLGT